MAQTIHLPKAKGCHFLSLGLAPAFAALLLLSGCASTPQPPTSALQAAEQVLHATNSRRPTVQCKKKKWCWPAASPNRPGPTLN
jgi:hypothetical protein